jgi:alkylation response protein AidB-like acyl-CoA dehydrogenase
MPVERLLPTEEAADLIGLVREIADNQLRPRASAAEAAAATDANAEFPRDVFATLGEAGLLSLPYPEEFGGGGQPYEVYLQVIEEIASAWMSRRRGHVSVHTPSPATRSPPSAPPSSRRPCCPGCSAATSSAPTASPSRLAGSDVGSMTTRADRRRRRLCDQRHQGVDLPRRPRRLLHDLRPHPDEGGRGISCFLVPAGTPRGCRFGKPEKKMGLHGDTVAEVIFDGVRVGPDRRIGAEGQGMAIALAALDNGRLGIAAAATGLAQSALDAATAYAMEREQFGPDRLEFQGLAFLLADMEAAVTSARAAYLYAARLQATPDAPTARRRRSRSSWPPTRR